MKTETTTNAVYDFAAAATSGTSVINGLNQVASYNSTSLGYDNRGNLTGDGSATYVYNANNLLTSVTAGGVTTTLAYDAENRLARVARTGMTPHTFLYDGQDLIAEYDDSGVMTTRPSESAVLRFVGQMP